MAGPSRNPYPLLVGLALVPALLLGGCWRFAVSKEPSASAPTTTVTGSTVPTAGLTTPLLSVRRTPAVLARTVNVAAFRQQLDTFLATLTPTECAAVAVDGQLVASVNEHTLLRPASNVKLLTAATALEVLGPGFHYTTTVKGTMTNGVVTGGLYFVGGGDPLLTSVWWGGPNTNYPPINITSIESLAASIKAAGVTQIQGGIIGDASRYDSEWYPPSWTNDVRFSEGGPVSALLANDSRESPTTSSNDPAIGAATVLTQALKDVGVTVTGKPSKGTTPKALATIASIDSKPLPDIIREMLVTSDNNTAEMLLKEIGYHQTGVGSREAGLKVVLSMLTKWNVPLDGGSLVDGSGLSDDDRLSCATILALLERHTLDDPIGKGLAVAGQSGSTLDDAFVGTPLEGKLRGKTGTLYNYSDGIGGKPGAKSLSGYVPVDGGGAVQFSLLLNGQTIAEKTSYRPIWDSFGKVLETYPSGPTVAELAPRT